MPLVIVESPAKCKKIQGFLGAAYRVIASMGHIRALVQDIDSIGISRNFEPTYEFMKEKAKAITQIKVAAKDADQIILCSDDDREGEAIAFSIAILLKLDPRKNPRVTFREITRNAVLHAIANPRTIDMNKVQSQQARAMLDMMVGFTISPLLWKYVGGSLALSAGRCQTPALRLVCEREQVITGFKSDVSWLIQGTWAGAEGAAAWPAIMQEALSDEESALNYLENHATEFTAKIRSATTKPWTESPPQPLMTSTLQQQASNLYHCAPKRTMQIAQKLYEAGHITYMRTDQTTMSEEAVEEARRVVEAKWGREYLASGKTGVMKGGKATQGAQAVQAQEAHEAIRPTHFDMSKLPESEDWGTQDHKIYHLIWLRAIQSTMAQAKGETREVIFDAEGDEGELPWLAKWRRTVFPGWKAADEKDAALAVAQEGDTAVDDPSAAVEQEGVQAWKAAEKLSAGQTLWWRSLKAQPKESKPQGRYTEATLVRDLEKRGIGRPSTFASLIATINEKAYVEIQDIPASFQEFKTHTLNRGDSWPPASQPFQLKRGGEKARLIPTPLGKSVMVFAMKHFPDLFAFDFTAEMESRLDKVAEGRENWKLVLGDTWNSYKDRISELKAASGTAVKSAKRREFEGGVIGVMSAKGPLLLREAANEDEKPVFYGWPPPGSTGGVKKGLLDITEEEVAEFVASVFKQKQGDTVGEWNGHAIMRRQGPYGLYVDWNGVKINVGAEDDVDAIITKIRAKQENPVRMVGPFQIRTGPYGPYLMRVGGSGVAKTKGVSKPQGTAKPQYVSIPKEADLDTLTAEQAGEIFEAGLKAKAKSKYRKN